VESAIYTRGLVSGSMDKKKKKKTRASVYSLSEEKEEKRGKSECWKRIFFTG
jgi:hypothetical protein